MPDFFRPLLCRLNVLLRNDPDSVVNIIRGWLTQTPGMPGRRKAAIVLVALGVGTSVRIFRKLGGKEADRLVAEIATLDNVTPDIREQALEELHHLIVAQQFIDQGGVDYAREALATALGPRRAVEILDRIHGQKESLSVSARFSCSPPCLCPSSA
jgi:flagellar motor switch protein FliG